MYAKFDEVVLVRATPRPTDPLIYEREYRGERILTPDVAPSQYATEAKRYGRYYVDSQDNLCVVPDKWADDDAWAAKSFRGNLDSWQED